MGSSSTHLLLLSSHPIIPFIINPRNSSINPTPSSNFRSYSSSKSNWDPFSDTFRSTRFEFSDEFSKKNRRNWWSDDEDDDEDEEEDDDDGFGFWEESRSFDWVFKVLRAFGWMVPAIMVSTLLGTGTNSLIMAVVLPLGQTALSLVMDKLWDGPSSSPNTGPRSKRKTTSKNRSRTKRNSYAGARNQRTAEARQAKRRTSPERGGYQSWRTGNSGSAKMDGESGSKFGGWDELDEQVGSSSSFSREVRTQEVTELQQLDTSDGKLTGMRIREKPLFMRLVFAVFPFLGSWTRFLF